MPGCWKTSDLHAESPGEAALASLFPCRLFALHTRLVQSAEPNLRLLESFLDYLKVEKGLAPLSVSAYNSDLEQYSEFLLKRKRALREARAVYNRAAPTILDRTS